MFFNKQNLVFSKKKIQVTKFQNTTGLQKVCENTFDKKSLFKITYKNIMPTNLQ